MALAKPNKKEEQRAVSIERILSCAIDLFVRNGYRATTVDMIAMQAGMTKGAVYFYFKTKEAVMLRLLDEAERIVVDRVISLMDESKTTARDKIGKFLSHQANIALSHPQHILLLILASIEFFGTETEIEVRVRHIYRRLYSAVERVIHQGQVEGTIRNDFRSHELTSVVMAQHDGTLIEWYRRPGEFDGPALARTIKTILQDALSKHLWPGGKPHADI